MVKARGWLRRRSDRRARVGHLSAKRLEECSGQADEPLYRSIVETTHEGVWVIDAEAKTVWVNRAMGRMLGYAPAEMIGQDLHQFMDAEAAAISRRNEERRRNGIEEQHEFRLRDRAGRDVWTLMETSPLYDAERRYCGALALVADISARKRRERDQRFLSEATELLAQTLDYDERFRRLAWLAVPELSDWCVVWVAAEDGTIRAAAIAHRDPAKRAVAQKLAALYPPRRDDPHGPGKVIQTSEPELIPEFPSGFGEKMARDPRHLELLRATEVRAGLAVPLVARGRTLGCIVLMMGESGRRFLEGDLRLVEELARRAALALDNARLYAASQEAVRVREHILGVVSHDLRNPLGAIKLASTLLRRELGGSLAPESATRRLDLIGTATTRMERLLHDLLDYASLEAGRLRVDRQHLEAGALFRELASGLSTYAEGRLLLAGPGPAVPAYLDADKDRIQQVLENLVDNAVKFSEPGEPVEVNAEVVGGELVVSVTDHGPGISDEAREHLFEPYWSRPGRNKKGTGLGLYISRGIVAQHGGRIWVRSAPGEGATFSFTLPLAPPLEQERGAATPG